MCYRYAGTHVHVHVHVDNNLIGIWQQSSGPVGETKRVNLCTLDVLCGSH